MKTHSSVSYIQERALHYDPEILLSLPAAGKKVETKGEEPREPAEDERQVEEADETSLCRKICGEQECP